ncbi:MAG: hypothetical protein ACNYVW_06855 [Methanosarcinales archaeon]
MKRKSGRKKPGEKRLKRNPKENKRLLAYSPATRAVIHALQKDFQMVSLEQAENQFVEDQIRQECGIRRKEKEEIKRNE